MLTKNPVHFYFFFPANVLLCIGQNRYNFNSKPRHAVSITVNASTWSKLVELRASRWIPCEFKSSQCSEMFFQAYWYFCYKFQHSMMILKKPNNCRCWIKNNFDVFKGLIRCQGPWFSSINMFAFDALLPRDHRSFAFSRRVDKDLKNAYYASEFKRCASKTEEVLVYIHSLIASFTEKLCFITHPIAVHWVASGSG